MATPTNSDIMEALGHMRGTIEAMQKQQTTADKSRSNIYKAIEATNRNISNLGFEVEKVVATQSQTRDEMKALHGEQKQVRADTAAANEALIKELKPLIDVKEDLPLMVEGWRDLNKTSKRLIWLLGLGGGGIIAFILFLGDAVKIALMNWLTIKPPGS